MADDSAPGRDREPWEDPPPRSDMARLAAEGVVALAGYLCEWPGCGAETGRAGKAHTMARCEDCPVNNVDTLADLLDAARELEAEDREAERVLAPGTLAFRDRVRRELRPGPDPEWSWPDYTAGLRDGLDGRPAAAGRSRVYAQGHAMGVSERARRNDPADQDRIRRATERATGRRDG